jgi:aspartyl/asparaginyl beta-hydroxylase (cupin superfamily)
MLVAIAARRFGDNCKASGIIKAILDREPAHPAALNLAGLLAQEEGRHADAVVFLRRAAEADPGAAPLWLNLAAASRLSGDSLAEIAALDRALVLDPTLLPALLSKAAALSRLGHIKESARAYRAVLTSATDEARLPPAVRAALDEGRAVVAHDDAARASRYDDAIEAVFAAHGGEDMRRARLYADALLGRRKLYQAQPTGPLFPQLPACEFFDRSCFPWFNALEAATHVIQVELARIWADGERVFDPYVQFAPGLPVNQWAELNRSPRWGAYFLWKDGVPQSEQIAACPQTAALLRSMPMLDIPGLAPTAMFSILDARTRIPPHTGVTNTRTTVHLPLVVPEGCGFRVGGDVRAWRVGEAWGFDDTIEHEAWNEGDRPRAILIIDVWNPLLNEAERAVVRASAAAMRL